MGPETKYIRDSRGGRRRVGRRRAVFHEGGPRRLGWYRETGGSGDPGRLLFGMEFIYLFSEQSPVLFEGGHEFCNGSFMGYDGFGRFVGDALKAAATAKGEKVRGGVY